MLIKPSQKSVFVADLERRYLQSVLHRLLDRHPELLLGIPPEQARAHVALAYRRARAHGLAQERTLTAFISLSFVIGPGFDAHPSFARHLRGAGAASADDRLRTAIERVRPGEWEGMKHDLSDASWADLEVSISPGGA